MQKKWSWAPHTKRVAVPPCSEGSKYDGRGMAYAAQFAAGTRSESAVWIATCAPVAASANQVLQAAAILMTDVASVCKAAKILGWPNSQTGGSTFRLP